jgi:hypothetical protein
MITFDDVVDLIQERYPYPWAKNRSIVFDWLVWFVTKRFAICVTEDHETIAGLMLLRPMMNATDGLWPYRFDHEGTVLYCDFIYANDDAAKRGLIIEAVKRFGRRETAAWQRRGRLRVYPAHKFVLHTLKEEQNVSA